MLHLENSKSKKEHNFVKKNWRITSPTGRGFLFDSEQLLLNFFSNNRDIRKCQSFRMMPPPLKPLETTPGL